VIATGGDSALGGDDYDAALADWVLAAAGSAAVTPTTSRAAGGCSACKEALTATEMVAFSA
jgi:molecular chaperone HscA